VRKDTPFIVKFDRCHPVRRPHEVAQGSDRRHIIRGAVGERHRCKLRRLPSGRTELDPPAEQQAGGDTMAPADLSVSCTRPPLDTSTTTPKKARSHSRPSKPWPSPKRGRPPFFAGAFDAVQSTYLDEPKVAEAFRTGKGVGWHEHSKCLFSGTERFFRPGYNANLVSNWIPTLEGVEAKLKTGARVADVGCGHGASTIVMAMAYPNSEFFGFDYHLPSIERARVQAREAGVGDRITFEQASAKDFPAKGL
jgi:hypothetical protein